MTATDSPRSPPHVNAAGAGVSATPAVAPHDRPDSVPPGMEWFSTPGLTLQRATSLLTRAAALNPDGASLDELTAYLRETAPAPDVEAERVRAFLDILVAVGHVRQTPTGAYTAPRAGPRYVALVACPPEAWPLVRPYAQGDTWYVDDRDLV